MKYFIITGTSSGLGEALAASVIKSKDKVFCISRKMNTELKELASKMHTGFWYFQHDLTDLTKLPDLMQEIFSYIDSKKVTAITLINNAGVVEPVKPLGTCQLDEIQNHITVNLTAPIILINEFIKQSKSLNCKKTIVNISSGAASHPYFGWNLYCSTKAGIDMVTRTVALEQQEGNLRIFSIAPGVLDTKMQAKIREVSEEHFPMKNRFVKLHEEQRLVKPATAAADILKMCDEDAPLNGSITDLRKMSK